MESRVQQGAVADVPREDGGELRVHPREPQRDDMTGDIETDADQPELHAEPNRSRQRPQRDRDAPRHAGQEDWLGERAVQRDGESRHRAGARERDHDTSAPPAKLKKVRKKLDAANAIDNPNTIWMRRRNPPEVSPKARVRPVVMM